MKNLYFLIFIILIFGCSSLVDENAPDFSISAEELAAAILKFRNSDKDVLVMVMVNHNGDVVRSKYIESRERMRARPSNQGKKALEFYVRKDLKFPDIAIEKDSFKVIFQAFDIDVVDY